MARKPRETIVDGRDYGTEAEARDNDLLEAGADDWADVANDEMAPEEEQALYDEMDDAELDDELGPMSEEQFNALVASAVTEAEDYIDEDLSPDRELAARYYRGEKFGNEEDGNSQVVMTEVRDAVLGMQAPLVEIFMGSNTPVEFTSNSGTPQEQADVQTAYVYHVLFKDNPGFDINLAVFKDALVRKTGIWSWDWEEKEIVTQTRFTGLGEESLALLEIEARDNSDADEKLEYEVIVTREYEDEFQPEGTGLPMDDTSVLPGDAALTGIETPKMYDGIIRKRIIRKRCRVYAVPPEEFLVSPITAATLEDVPLVGRRQMKTISDIVALGHDEFEIREILGGHGSTNSDRLRDNVEALDRSKYTDRIFDNGISESDPASEVTKYCELYMLVDFDGDGIAERRKIVTIGDNNIPIYNEIYDDDIVPYATVCPDPEPHTMFGQSIADQTMDLQEIKSELARGMLDNLSNSIVQRMGIIEGRVNIDDALNNQNRAVIRMKDPQALFPINSTFVGMNIIPVMEYMDQVKVKRTGVNPASPTALDPNALQSTAKEAVGAAVDASQERIRLVARIFAETGFQRLMRGIRNLIMRNQDFRRMVELNGEMVVIDPRSWRADIDTYVNVGTGRGTADKMTQTLLFILAQQREIYQTNAENGIVTLKHITYTMEQIIKLSGYKDVTKFMNRATPEIEANIAKQQQAQANRPTPEQLLYNATSEKTQSQERIANEREQTQRLKLAVDNEFKYDDMHRKLVTDATKIMGQYGIQMSEMEFEQAMREQQEADALADRMEAATQPQLAPPSPQKGQMNNV